MTSFEVLDDGSSTPPPPTIVTSGLFARFMEDSVAHGGAVAKGSVRRFLQENAEFIGDDVVRFRDGSEIHRADKPLAPEALTRSRGMGR